MPGFDPLSFGLSLLGGGISGMFSGQPQLPPYVEAALRQMMQEGKWFKQYGAGVPGSAPQEEAALASAQGLLGEQAAHSLGGLQATGGYATGVNPNSADAMGRFNQSLLGQRAGINSQMLQNFLQNRLDARKTASQIFGQVGGLGGPGSYQPSQTGNIGQLFGQLMQQYGYQKNAWTGNDGMGGRSASPTGFNIPGFGGGGSGTSQNEYVDPSAQGASPLAPPTMSGGGNYWPQG